MAIRAVLWRGLVKENHFAQNLAFQGMTLGTAYIFVRPCQGELSALIVVECGRGPSLIHVAVRAFCHTVLGRKLRAMRIRVTSFTLLGSALELNIVGAGEHFVTIGTPDGPMAA